jgi:hypothetical protein
MSLQSRTKGDRSRYGRARTVSDSAYSSQSFMIGPKTRWLSLARSVALSTILDKARVREGAGRGGSCWGAGADIAARPERVRNAC